jgi:hypothetical protein
VLYTIVYRSAFVDCIEADDLLTSDGWATFVRYTVVIMDPRTIVVRRLLLSEVSACWHD